jgi:transglycosylase-like protein with SLT domain/peptidase M23-like protein
MQSRKTKARHGRPKSRAGSRRASKRGRSPRQVLVVGLTVGGLTTSLFGAAAGAQSAEPAITESAGSTTADAALAQTPDAGTSLPDPDDGGQDPQPSDPETQPDPAASAESPPATDPGPAPPAPAAPEAAAPAQGQGAAVAPTPGAPVVIPAFRPGRSSGTKKGPKATKRPRSEDAAGTGGRPHRHTHRAGGQRVKQSPLKPGEANEARTPAAATEAPDLAASSTFAPLGPLSISVPGASIDSFRVPLFLLPIYQAAGTKYGVSWNLLAAINEIETDYGRNLNVSSAGAVGWMQFMPSTWDRYGVDANRDGIADPYNPVDAIFAAARYLRAAGAQEDLRRAVLAYNHAGWYADDVLARAQMIGGLPGDLVDSLSALAVGRLPVRVAGAEVRAADAGSDDTYIDTRAGQAVVAVNDGTIARVGHARRLGRFVRLRDGAGNTYTYGHLSSVGKGHHKRLRLGAHVTAGAMLGRAGAHLLFEIRPGGRSAPRVDPKPILDGWRLLQRAGMNRVHEPSRGGLLLSKTALASRVLSDPRVQIYGCGRGDIRAGAIDRRVLATLEFLSTSGFAPTVSSLRCGHSLMTSSGNVSEHSTGSAVDIAAINGTPIAGHQGPGSITETVVRRLLTLQGAMKPHQIITLMQFPGTDNTLAMADHADHIHVGWRSLSGTKTADGRQVGVSLGRRQWTRLISRIGHATR